MTYHWLKIPYGQFFALSKQNVFNLFGLVRQEKIEHHVTQSS